MSGEKGSPQEQVQQMQGGGDELETLGTNASGNNNGRRSAGADPDKDDDQMRGSVGVPPGPGMDDQTEKQGPSGSGGGPKKETHRLRNLAIAFCVGLIFGGPFGAGAAVALYGMYEVAKELKNRYSKDGRAKHDNQQASASRNRSELKKETINHKIERDLNKIEAQNLQKQHKEIKAELAEMQPKKWWQREKKKNEFANITTDAHSDHHDQTSHTEIPSTARHNADYHTIATTLMQQTEQPLTNPTSRNPPPVSRTSSISSHNSGHGPR